MAEERKVIAKLQPGVDKCDYCKNPMKYAGKVGERVFRSCGVHQGRAKLEMKELMATKEPKK